MFLRLHNEPLSAQAQSKFLVFLVCVGRGVKYERYLSQRVVPLTLPAQMVAVHPGHEDVRDYHVDGIRFQDFQCLYAVHGRYYLVAALLQPGFKQLEVYLQIIYNKDFHSVSSPWQNQ